MTKGPFRAPLGDLTGKDHRQTTVANAYFPLFMAVGYVLGFATGSYSGWFKVFPFTVSAACDAACANLKSTPVDKEAAGNSSNEQEDFLWELFGTFKYFPNSVWIILSVTALNWIGWFPFLLFDTDWMGREMYGGMPNEGENYTTGVRMGALGLMLNSIFLRITSILMEKLCPKWGAGFILGSFQHLHALCFLSMLIISYVANHQGYLGHDLPPTGILIASLFVFSVLGVPLVVTYSVPHALVS